MAKFTKYNNPNKKRRPRQVSRLDAEIIAGKAILTDRRAGYTLPLSYYEELAENLTQKNDEKRPK